MKEEEKIGHMRHSLAHLLAAAVLELYPDAKPTLGPAIDNGFYYDFDFGTTTVSDKDLPKIEERMREILKTWEAFSGEEVSIADARVRVAGNPYKLELVDDIERKGERITFYTSGSFTDLCRGGHVANVKEIDPKGFRLDRVAGAYWRGNEKNKMLTRIYGLAFESQKDLDLHIAQRDEAKKRDHKKLGRELDLFTFSELVGAGLPLWTPHGTTVRDMLDGYVWELRKRAGYERVEIPHITKKDLYVTSGHWDKFKDELFKIETREKHIFAMKPMNCPHHTQIYARKKWSYRELPQRYANSTMCYRDEQSGELSGLSRVRAFTQDDAHVFCRMSQVRDEFLRIWDIVHSFYGTFGFGLRIRISKHNPAEPDKYLGDKELWAHAERILEDIAREKEVDHFEGIGEAAFYGPKLDFMAKDAIGREWQVATIQLDMNMPERFDLSCTNEDGKEERIVMIHAAIMGSIDRFLSILIEHTAGAFPLWLSPVQVKVIPIKDTHVSYAREVFASLERAGIRAEICDPFEGLGKSVRAAKVEKIPYWLVIGDKEVDAQNVTLESRDKGNLGQIAMDELVRRFLEEIKEKK